MIQLVRILKSFILLTALSCPQVLADPYRLQYGGRIVNSNGQPIQGPVNLDIIFYNSHISNTPLASQSFTGVTLTSGVFQVIVNLTDADFHTVFSSSEVWIEVSDLTNGKIYPRQQFTSVPFAFKTPTDGSTIDYDSNGKLKLIGIEGAPLPSGSPADGQVLKWSNGSWVWADDLTGGSANSVDSTIIADDSITNSDIASSASIDQSKINGLISDLAGKEPSIAAGAVSQYWSGNKTWQTLDTDAVSEGTNQYYTDARARNAVSSDGGALSYNSSTGQFSMPVATSVTDGYLSSGDWLNFNNKQNAISSSATINAGTVTSAQQAGFELKPYGTLAGQSGELRFDELSGNGSNYVGFKAPDDITVNEIWTLPDADGSSGQCLVTDGNGVLSWTNLNSGTVTSITAGTGLSGGTINGSGTIDLANTTVTAGSYSRANITVDAQGRLTAATNGTDVNLGSEVTGTLPLANGGTAASTAADARTNFGLGSLATASVVTGGAGGTITDDSITNADISSSAAIADSKLATISTAGKVANSATTADSANTANAIVVRDVSGNFSAGTITANLAGNADTATTAGSVSGTVALANGGTGATTAADARTNLELGSLATASAVSGGAGGSITDNSITNADVSSTAAIATSKLSGAITDIASHGLGSLATASAVAGGAGGTITDNSITNDDISTSASIADSKLATISTTGKVANSATTATSSNTANTIVARDVSGNFSANAVTVDSTFRLGQFASDPAGLTASDEGMMWFNTTESVVKVWDGTATQLVNVTSTVPRFTELTLSVPVIEISPASTGFDVTLSHSTGGTTLVYTMDGQEPSAVYAGLQLYASTFNIGWDDGSDLTFKFAGFNALFASPSATTTYVLKRDNGFNPGPTVFADNFTNPNYSIAVTGAGNSYITEYQNCNCGIHEVNRYDSSASYISSFGSYGSGNGQLYGPYSVTVDSSGNVYVAENQNNRIQKFSSTGTYSLQWAGKGYLTTYNGTTILAANGTTVTKYNTSGTSQGSFTLSSSINGNGISAFSTSIYAATSAGIEIYDINGTLLETVNALSSPGGSDIPLNLNYIRKVVQASNGDFLFIWGNSVVRASSTWTWLGIDHFNNVRDLGIDDSDQVYVLTSSGVQRYTIAP